MNLHSSAPSTPILLSILFPRPHSAFPDLSLMPRWLIPENAIPSQDTAPKSQLGIVWESLVRHGTTALEKSDEMQVWLDRMQSPPSGRDLYAETAMFMQLVADFIAEHREMHIASQAVGYLVSRHVYHRLDHPTTRTDAEQTIKFFGSKFPKRDYATMATLHSIASGRSPGGCTRKRYTLNAGTAPNTQRYLCKLLTAPTPSQKAVSEALWANVCPAQQAINTLSETPTALVTPTRDSMPLPELVSVIARGRPEAAEYDALNPSSAPLTRTIGE